VPTTLIDWPATERDGFDFTGNVGYAARLQSAIEHYKVSRPLRDSNCAIAVARKRPRLPHWCRKDSTNCANGVPSRNINCAITAAAEPIIGSRDTP
jgi:hypothetical protein